MSDKLSELWDCWSDIEGEADQMTKTLEEHVAFLEQLADTAFSIYMDIDLELREAGGGDDMLELMADVSDELFVMRSAINRRIDKMISQ